MVDVYVRYLRNKLDRMGEPSLIVSVRGAGYRFDPPSATAQVNAEDGGIARREHLFEVGGVVES